MTINAVTHAFALDGYDVKICKMNYDLQTIQNMVKEGPIKIAVSPIQSSRKICKHKID